jgi:hypothetical protein
VRSSRVFFLFLTNNVFNSPWCMMELVEADAAGAVLVPVLVEGAAWGLHGARKVREYILALRSFEGLLRLSDSAPYLPASAKKQGLTLIARIRSCCSFPTSNWTAPTCLCPRPA